MILLLLPGYSSGQLINGDFSSGLFGWDLYGDVTAEDGMAILHTGGIYGAYDTSLYTTFVVSGNRLDFKYYFDITGPDDVMSPDYPSYPFDSFQVSLDAGDDGYLVEALAWEPSGGFVPFSLDISNFRPGTPVTLSFDLLDQDDGFTSVAAIDDVMDPIASVPEPATLILMGSGLIGFYLTGRYRRYIKCRPLIIILLVIVIPGMDTAHGAWIEENVDDLTRIDFASPVFNTRTNTLSLSMVVANVSDESMQTPLKVVITGISAADVTVANPDGYTGEGLPYFDLTEYIADHELSPGEASPPVKVLFYNPKRVKFRWEQDVLAFVDVYTEAGPVLENICLVPGEFPPVCEYDPYDVEVENPEFDKLLGRQLPEMYRIEQVRVYAYDNEELPLRVAINGTDAAYNEDGFYYYSDLILHDGLNTISVEVTNETGIRTVREFALDVDTVPPAIEMIQPVAGSVVTSQEVLIEGVVDDPAVEDIALIYNYMNIQNVPVSAGRFYSSIPMQPGHNNVTIEASDLSGNSMSTNLDIVYAYSGTSEISGHIFNGPLGLPVSGALVTVIPQTGDYISVMSDGDGTYRVDAVRSGDVTIRVEKDGYEPKDIRICALGGDSPSVRDVTLQPVTLTGTFTLTGQITNTGGQSVEGATVAITAGSMKAISDSNGIYLISGIPRSSFEADVSLMGYIDAGVSVNSEGYSTDTSVLIHNFILRGVNYFIGISYPAEGGYIASEETVVKGVFRSEGIDAGVRVNGVPATVYHGSFVANKVPLSEGMNIISAEMINELGTLATDSMEIFRTAAISEVVHIHTQEAGIVPATLSVTIEGPSGISFTEGNLQISGPSAAALVSDGRLHYTVSINEPGIYLLTFNGTDSNNNNFGGEFSFTGMTRDDAEGMLRQRWGEFKNHLISGNTEDALSMMTPETRGRYKGQFLMAGSGLSDFFSAIGDIQLVTLSDNMAKTRLYQGDVTHYIWFARDIYGIWRIHKF